MMQRPLALRAVFSWTLLGLFLLRVLGQIYVGLYSPAALPPWREWYSGLLPYPLLLPAQLLLLMWMTIVNYDNTRGAGRFLVESAAVKRRLRWIAAIYADAMLLRYILTMTLRPEMRWVHGTTRFISYSPAGSQRKHSLQADATYQLRRRPGTELRPRGLTSVCPLTGTQWPSRGLGKVHAAQ